MVEVETLRQLLARVEGAEDEDWELDRDIGLALDGWTYLPPDHEICVKFPERRWLDNGETIFADSPGAMIDPNYTASVDDTLALVGRVMPGRPVAMTVYADGTASAAMAAVSATAATPALALLAALLRAKIAETEHADD